MIKNADVLYAWSSLTIQMNMPTMTAPLFDLVLSKTQCLLLCDHRENSSRSVALQNVKVSLLGGNMFTFQGWIHLVSVAYQQL